MWTYFRIYWLGNCIYVLVTQLHWYAASPYMQPSFGLMLICLLILHIYWQAMMLSIIWAYIKKGPDAADDTVDNSKHGLIKAKEGSI
jgi:hypothetical protein